MFNFLKSPEIDIPNFNFSQDFEQINQYLKDIQKDYKEIIKYMDDIKSIKFYGDE